MCGLAGQLGSEPLPQQALAAMQAALAHRGPDGRGHWSDPALPGVQLLHSRLAIQDLSPAGRQPMLSACGRYVLLFNGEIYNQRELRQGLERQGHCFVSSSDTEVLLQLLIRYDTAALQRLQGMYAFCFWDRHRRRALLARDPFGIKPLYLWQGAAGQLLFASELRALLASGVIPRRLDRGGLQGFLASGSLPGSLTLVQGIRSLQPGWCGLWCDGDWRSQPHWSPSFAPGLPRSRADRIAVCRAALQASVQAHQLSDVPLGLFLSGGLDSAALLALSSGSLTTLTVGFAEARYDESARAQALARQQGLQVVLSGLGGDELFGGYPSFQRIPRMLRLHRALGPLRPLLAGRLLRQRSHLSQRLAAFLQGPASLVAAQACLRGLFAATEIKVLLRHWGLEPCPAPPSPLPDEPLLEPRGIGGDGDAISWLELSAYMGPQLLRDADVFSMAHGLELRLPLVEAGLFRVLSAMPASLRLAAGKRLLRQAVPELQAVLPRVPKQGFQLPYQVWFDQPGSSLRPGSEALPLPSVPSGLDLSPWARRWGLMVLRDWLQRHLQIELG